MNALIFSAGLGTRLAPLTANTPKALVELNGKPLISYALAKCAEVGVTRVVVNVHHFGDQIINYLATQHFDGMQIIISDERDLLLDTGGGLIKALPLFESRKPILLYNVDVITNANLWELKTFHYRNDGIASVMINKRVGSERYFLFNDDLELCGWENVTTGERIISREEKNYERWGFCGIHIVEYDFVEKLGEIRKFSITKGYLDIAVHEKIVGWSKWDGFWFDVGSPQKLAEASQAITQIKMV